MTIRLRVRRCLAYSALWMTCLAIGRAQNSPVSSIPAKRPTACQSPAHRALDFWIGEWDVTNAAGKVAGHSSVNSILDGCVIMENWTSNGSVYEGKSFNVFDPASGTWTQTWVDNTGSPAQMTGEFHGKDLVYRREFKKADGAPVRSRMTFFDLGAAGVRQLIEESTDGGKTWTAQYDLSYPRRKNN